VYECKPQPTTAHGAHVGCPVLLVLGYSATLAQGRTLVHFSAQHELCLAQEHTLHTLNTPYHPLYTGYTTPTRTPYPIKSAQVEPRSERV
jgi:hypothetical protein